MSQTNYDKIWVFLLLKEFREKNKKSRRVHKKQIFKNTLANNGF